MFDIMATGGIRLKTSMLRLVHNAEELFFFKVIKIFPCNNITILTLAKTMIIVNHYCNLSYLIMARF